MLQPRLVAEETVTEQCSEFTLDLGLVSEALHRLLWITYKTLWHLASYHHPDQLTCFLPCTTSVPPCSLLPRHTGCSTFLQHSTLLLWGLHIGCSLFPVPFLQQLQSLFLSLLLVFPAKLSSQQGFSLSKASLLPCLTPLPASVSPQHFPWSNSPPIFLLYHRLSFLTNVSFTEAGIVFVFSHAYHFWIPVPWHLEDL